MSAEKARELIERAMTDRAAYDAMAAREGEVWGAVLPARERSAARAEDEAAARALRVNRYRCSLEQLAREKALHFSRGVSLGCGEGRLEGKLLQTGTCDTIHGLDVSEEAVAEARAIAKRENLALTYATADLNFVYLPAKVSTSWCRNLPSILPEKFRANTMNGRVTTQIKTPEPGRLASPFEKIRSAEIVEVFERWFTIEWRWEDNTLLHLIAPPRTRAAFAENEETRALYEVLLALDQLCLKEGILPPTGGQYLLRPKSPAEIGA